MRLDRWRRDRIGRRLARGLAAGATGTIALELTTYLDLLARARPASDQPQRLGAALVERFGLAFGSGERAKTRASGLGSAAGYVDGLAIPMVYAAISTRRRPAVAIPGLLFSLAAMVGSNGPAIALGVTDPREWSVDDWLTDAVPHLVYGFVAASTFRALSRE